MKFWATMGRGSRGHFGLFLPIAGRDLKVTLAEFF